LYQDKERNGNPISFEITIGSMVEIIKAKSIKLLTIKLPSPLGEGQG
jgi:hypothetical protein